MQVLVISIGMTALVGVTASSYIATVIQVKSGSSGFKGKSNVNVKPSSRLLPNDLF